MKKRINPDELFTPFLPSTQNIPEDQDRLNVFLIDNLNLYADVINDKKIGTFVQEKENFNGDKYFYKTTKVTRNGYQTIAFIPSFPPTLILTLTSNPRFPIEGIDFDFVVADVIGSASKPPDEPDTLTGSGDYFSFMAQGDSRISFTMSNKQIIITTTIDMSKYSGFIKITYIRDGT